MHAVRWLASPRQGKALLNDFCRAFGHSKARETQRIFSLFFKDTSSVSLWLTPSPTGEGWRKSLLSSAHKPNSRPPCTFSGRADNACTNLLGYLVRYVRTRGIVEAAESGKTIDFCFVPCRTHSPRMARATSSCTPPVVRKEDGASPPC